MTDANGILSAMQISDKRLKHTLGVAEAAKELARDHFPELDQKVIELAALMHDFTKEYTFERQLELCNVCNIPLTNEEFRNPKLLHAKTGAKLASDSFGLPEDACNAIFWHTTGRADMTPFEIVIYLADYIEEFRTDQGCIRLRQYYEKLMAKESDKSIALIKTLIRSFDTTIKHLIDKGDIICETTLAARNFYVNQLAERTKI